MAIAFPNWNIYEYIIIIEHEIMKFAHTNKKKQKNHLRYNQKSPAKKGLFKHKKVPLRTDLQMFDRLQLDPRPALVLSWFPLGPETKNLPTKIQSSTLS